ncbi:hypothetical protein AQ477_29995 [Burkholderia thailandensis]|nr:hypothetical protein AQ477_29995 [Burkholderia thailandensis]KXF57624.1 hypothetical protein AQ476_22890 [Burkholderia thailandensis]
MQRNLHADYSAAPGSIDARGHAARPPRRRRLEIGHRSSGAPHTLHCFATTAEEAAAPPIAT